MLADMDESGAVVLIPESNVEKIALQHWRDGNLVAREDLARMEKTFYRGSCLKIGPIKPKQ